MDILPTRYLDALPLFLVFILTVALLLLFSEAGFEIGKRRSRSQKEEWAQTGVITGATLGLLAFMLAFTFGMAGSRLESRISTVLAEANAVGTTWLRSKYLPEPLPEQLEPLFLRYVETRLEAPKQAKDLQHLAELLGESVEIQNRLWSEARMLAREYPRSVVLGLYIESLNEMIDLHEARLNVVRYRLPRGVMATLFITAFAASTMVGISAGQAGTRGLPVTVLLVVSLSVVIALITDLDRPQQALFKVNQQALEDLRDSIQASPF